MSKRAKQETSTQQSTAAGASVPSLWQRFAGWALLSLLVPLAIGVAVLGVELASEKPQLEIRLKEMPDADAVLFYQAVMSHKMHYDEKWSTIRIDGLPPFDDPNPVFTLSELPPLDVPLTFINTGRKATTLDTFDLTMYGQTALLSEPGVLLDDNGQPALEDGIYLDVGQKKDTIVRFEWRSLDENATAPQYTGLLWDNEVPFRGVMKVSARDVAGDSGSVLIETGRLRLNTDKDLIWWSSLNKPVPVTSISGNLRSELMVEKNPYILGAYLVAGGKALSHNCPDCAVAHLSRILEILPNHQEALYLRGTAYAQLNRVQDAADDFAACLAIGAYQGCSEGSESLRSVP